MMQSIAMPTWVIMLPYCLAVAGYNLFLLNKTDTLFFVLVIILVIGLDWSEPSHCSDSDDD